MKTRLRFTTLGLLALGTLFLVFLGCTTDSPTEPQQGAVPGAGVSGGWTIQISASASRMMAGGESIVFTASIANRTTGAPPPDGATAIVSTSLGLIGDPVLGAQAVVLSTFRGVIGFEVFSEDEEGTATIVVSFQDATARLTVQISRELFLFIRSISPDSSGIGGGVTVTIVGENFVEPLRLSFVGASGTSGEETDDDNGTTGISTSGIGLSASSDLANIISVTDTRIVAIAPAYTAGPLFDGEFDSVDVLVELFEADGSGGSNVFASDEIVDGFTYFGSGQADFCGDGNLDEPDEECDDGNLIGGDGCRADCTLEICGDGTQDPQEACDDGNILDGDGCRSDCTLESCGDDNLDAGEDCDDGNNTSGDGCRADCTLEVCHDGIVDPGEECDDGNFSDSDSCVLECKAATCGDDKLFIGEEDCDDGNLDGGDGCRSDCTLEVCGDGIEDPGEGCDDGNLGNGDGCDSDCVIE